VRTYLAKARAAMAPVVRGDVIFNLSPADTVTRLRDSLGDSRIDAAADGRTGLPQDCVALPACQLHTGSSPCTSLSANSSIMLRSYSSIVSILSLWMAAMRSRRRVRVSGASMSIA
jgi:hypothetical protein